MILDLKPVFDIKIRKNRLVGHEKSRLSVKDELIEPIKKILRDLESPDSWLVIDQHEQRHH
jgi:hypothetical protein